MPTDMPCDLHDRLIALGADRRASIITWNLRETSTADWTVASVVTADNHAVHADYWERHPAGDEALFLLEGRLAIVWATLSAGEHRANLQAGQTFVVPKGAWHRLEVLEPGRLIVITPPAGTEHRRRKSQPPA